MSDPLIPQRNTTTALLHFNPIPDAPPRLDTQFTVRGIRTGKWLGQWVRLLIQEHGDPTLDATIEVWHHHPDGRFEPTEITTCAP